MIHFVCVRSYTIPLSNQQGTDVLVDVISENVPKNESFVVLYVIDD